EALEYKASSRFPIWSENFLKSFKKQCPKSQFSLVIKNKHRKKGYDPHVPQKRAAPGLVCVPMPVWRDGAKRISGGDS
ncbi:MAG: hypothetical protein MR999_05995, partial [Flintibacter sp.]|uniref:hypothetical protein n=1 Tax=Flintibacter sp. TaxID=1918624 RepID=UPI002D7EF732